MPEKPHFIATISVIVAIFLIDQSTKFLAVAFLKPLSSVTVLGEFLRFTYVENSGIAFGFNIQNTALLNIISMIIAIMIFYVLLNIRDHQRLRVAAATILGGAAGNLFDRLYRGNVVDFIDINFFDIHFDSINLLLWQFHDVSIYRLPVFNIADISVTIGMVLVITTVLSKTHISAIATK
ncbi:MAG: signal peptidase II [Calditrichia bacterium]|nr:signal peptidase II [Calditrichota bacterium]MCB0269437.1 signal peptidase II [Calditrichota bacterium]MCB0286254.1 signal peptidase II [Calditrichota bacterium]